MKVRCSSTHIALPLTPPPQIAVEGCCHGELDKIYEAMRCLEAKEGLQIDLLICCGDFQVRMAPSRAPSPLTFRQAVRNEDDLACMSVPDKYKAMGTFYKVRSDTCRCVWRLLTWLAVLHRRGGGAVPHHLRGRQP